MHIFILDIILMFSSTNRQTPGFEKGKLLQKSRRIQIFSSAGATDYLLRSIYAQHAIAVSSISFYHLHCCQPAFAPSSPTNSILRHNDVPVQTYSGNSSPNRINWINTRLPQLIRRTHPNDASPFFAQIQIGRLPPPTLLFSYHLFLLLIFMPFLQLLLLCPTLIFLLLFLVCNLLLTYLLFTSSFSLDLNHSSSLSIYLSIIHSFYIHSFMDSFIYFFILFFFFIRCFYLLLLTNSLFGLFILSFLPNRLGL